MLHFQERSRRLRALQCPMFAELEAATQAALECTAFVAKAEDTIRGQGLANLFQRLTQVLKRETALKLDDLRARIVFNGLGPDSCHQRAFDLVRQVGETVRGLLPARADGRPSLTWTDPVVFTSVYAAIRAFSEEQDLEDLACSIRTEHDAAVSSLPQPPPPPHDLAEVIEAWPDLSPENRCAIRAIIIETEEPCPAGARIVSAWRHLPERIQATIERLLATDFGCQGQPLRDERARVVFEVVASLLAALTRDEKTRPS